MYTFIYATPIIGRENRVIIVYYTRSGIRVTDKKCLCESNPIYYIRYYVRNSPIFDLQRY